MRTRIKICGITNAEDLAATVAAGADAIGFNLFEQSARFVPVDRARELAQQVPPYITKVGLLVNPDASYVRAICSEVPLDMLQFQGDETDAFCSSFGLPFMKAIRVAPDTDIAARMNDYPHSSGFLLDTFHDGEWGGTGQRFDWACIPATSSTIVLAGGLDPDNVAEAIKTARPYAVDICSGVESSRGKKDHAKLAAFFAAVKRADEESNE